MATIQQHVNFQHDLLHSLFIFAQELTPFSQIMGFAALPSSDSIGECILSVARQSNECGCFFPSLDHSFNAVHLLVFSQIWREIVMKSKLFSLNPWVTGTSVSVSISCRTHTFIHGNIRVLSTQRKDYWEIPAPGWCAGPWQKCVNPLFFSDVFLFS